MKRREESVIDKTGFVSDRQNYEKIENGEVSSNCSNSLWRGRCARVELCLVSTRMSPARAAARCTAEARRVGAVQRGSAVGAAKVDALFSKCWPLFANVADEDCEHRYVVR